MFIPLIKKGDTIGVVAPSSRQVESKIMDGVKKLEELGFKVILGDSCNKQIINYTKEEDEIKAKDINDMFENDEIDVIICQNGGYGSPRIIDKLDFQMIKKHPKPFVGFSDITLILNALYKKCGFGSYHGPMVAVDFYTEKQKKSIESFLEISMTKEEIIINKNKEYDVKVINEGISEGVLVGGNLSLLDVLISSEYMFDPKGKILLIEEVQEPNYRIDRMMQKMRLAGVLDKLSGIVIGGITGEDTPQKGSFEKFKEILSQYNYPVLFNLPIGHVTPRLTVPIGAEVKIDTYEKTLTIKERR